MLFIDNNGTTDTRVKFYSLFHEVNLEIFSLINASLLENVNAPGAFIRRNTVSFHSKEQKYKTVLFIWYSVCFVGFMCGSSVLDKDGVSAAMVASEMATYLYEQDLTLHKQLDNIYQRYVLLQSDERTCMNKILPYTNNWRIYIRGMFCYNLMNVLVWTRSYPPQTTGEYILWIHFYSWYTNFRGFRGCQQTTNLNVWRKMTIWFPFGGKQDFDNTNVCSHVGNSTLLHDVIVMHVMWILNKCTCVSFCDW